MIDLGCLQGPLPPAADMLFSDGVFDSIAIMLLIAMLIAAVAAPLVRRRYRQRVVRLMGLNQVARRGPAVRQADGATLDSSSGQAGGATDADGLAALAGQREQRVTRATAAAWMVFVFTAAWVAGIDPRADLSGRLGFATVAGLLALGPALINLPPRWSRWALAVGVIACVAALVLMGSVGGDDAADAGGAEVDEEMPVWQLVLFALLAGAAYLAMFHRTLRGQVLPLFVVLSVGLVVFLAPVGYLERHAGSCLSLLDAAQEGSLLKSAAMLVVTLMIVSGLWLSFVLLGALARLIDRGWVSELSLPSVVALAVFAVVMVMNQLPDEAGSRSAWMLWTPLPWLAVTLGAYALALGRPSAGGPGPQLLVLRVFSEDTRRHTLLDEVQARWRYVGAVHQIGGPDMVAMNVDPYESTLFLANRLHELFLPEAASPAQLRSSLVTTPDREGRYRINEVFCFNTAWRNTVVQLMHLSDAIALDLRGLTAQREGTSFEIGQLAHGGLLPRVVAVGDESTDWTHVEALLQAEGQDPRQLKRLVITEAPPSAALFTQLLQAAASRSAPAVPAPSA